MRVRVGSCCTFVLMAGLGCKPSQTGANDPGADPPSTPEARGDDRHSPQESPDGNDPWQTVRSKCVWQPDTLRKCERARAHPDAPLRWELYMAPLDPDVDEDYAKARLEELLAVAERHGFEARGGVGRVTSAKGAATYRELAAVVASDLIWKVDVTCVSGPACDCAVGPDACADNPFCHVIRGYLPNEPATAARPVACMSPHHTCMDMQGRATDPEGTTWILPSTCRPETPGWRLR